MEGAIAEMEPVPSQATKTYPQRGPLQQFRFQAATAFRFFRCGATKKAKLITFYAGDWVKRLCNGCYGRLLSLYDVKAGAGTEDQRAEELAAALLSIVALSDQREAERLFRASEQRAATLSSEAVKFLATAEHVAAQLREDPHLEWSPAVIGLCKAVEVEVVNRLVVPLGVTVGADDLREDERDKDVGRVAAYCRDSNRKPPELGAFAHFLQTVIHSQRRRDTSVLLKGFLRLAGGWTGSNWILGPSAFHSALSTLTANFRNRAAHIDELSREDYMGCRELVIGADGLLWRLVVATEPHA